MIINDTLFSMNVFGTVGTNSSNNKQWKEDLETQLSKISPSKTFGIKLAIKAKFFINPSRLVGNRLDVDNLQKVLFDSMKKAGIIHDDSLIHFVQVSKHPISADENVELDVMEWT